VKQLIEYTEYRAYLTDWLKIRKSEGHPVSNRWIARLMGINSTSWLTQILQGRRNLTKDTANRLSEILKHDAAQSRYFETLVFFNQARTLDKRNRYYRELCLLQKGRAVKVVDTGQHDFYSAWHHSAVRSLIGLGGFDGDYARLASLITPAITPAQARASVKALEKLGLIVKDEQGRYALKDTAITTGDEVRSLAISNFQLETMRLAQEAFDRFKAPDRDIRTLSVGVSAKVLKEIYAVLADARRRIVELANADPDADRVMQINMQVFPLSKAVPKQESRS
jgi:uncharacterized protein (TIGR02147 family)